MKKGILFFLFILGIQSVISQNIIAVQDFENTGDTWVPLTFSTPPCTNGSDVWNYTTSLPGISPNSGSQFWGIRDLDGNCGGNGFETITFPNINISSFTNVVFSFDYNAISFDNNDDLKYELFFDNVSQGEVVVVDGVGGNSDNTNGWITETVSIPGSATNVSLVLSARNNSGNDRGGFDNVRLEEASEGSCFGAQSLTVYPNSESSGNEILANTLSTTPSAMSLTSCDGWGDNYDLFYTFTVPQEENGINVITGGANGSTINVAIWDDCNGNEVYCNNENSSLHEVAGLTPGTTYILQVWHDFGFGSDNRGEFTIALETPQPPANNGSCTAATILQVYPEGMSSGNEITANTLTTTPSNLSLTSCDRWGDNYDLFYTFTAPLGTTSINVLTNGTNGNTINLAVWDECNGSEVFCSNDNSSLHEITGLTPGTSYILQVWHDFGFGSDNRGEFTIALEYSIECSQTTLWNSSGWNNGPPNSYTTAIINSDYDTQTHGSFESCNCQINSNATLNISEDNHITVYNDLTINGVLDVRNNGSLYIAHDNAVIVNNGTFNAYKESALLVNNLDYTYWSSPVENATVANVFSNANVNRVFYWDQSADDNGPGGDVGDPTITLGRWFNASGNMIPGKGYISQGPTTGTYPQTHSILFSGNPGNGDITLAGAPHMVYNDDNNDYSDYNLIGNPYPTALSAEQFLAESINNSIDGTIWFWTHNTQNNGNPTYQYTTDDYASYTIGLGGVAACDTCTPPTEAIGLGQGFMIRAISANPSVTFNETMRLQSNNTQFFRTDGTKKSAVEKNRLWLNIQSSDGGAFNQILIGFLSQATDGKDRYDGLKNGASWISFYSKIDSLRLSAQGLGSFTIDKEVKLGFDTYIDQPLSYTIHIANIEGVLKDNDLYLVDHILGVTHDLKQSPYAFDVNGVGYFDDRFTLQFKKSIIDVDELNLSENDFVIVNNENSLTIKSHTIITRLKVYDMLGRLLIDKEPNDSNFDLPTPNIRKGTVLILNATFDSGEKTTSKKILRH